jgi:hypothetical protein
MALPPLIILSLIATLGVDVPMLSVESGRTRSVFLAPTSC